VEDFPGLVDCVEYRRRESHHRRIHESKYPPASNGRQMRGPGTDIKDGCPGVLCIKSSYIKTRFKHEKVLNSTGRLGIFDSGEFIDLCTLRDILAPNDIRDVTTSKRML
jgi:hypothetical protein